MRISPLHRGFESSVRGTDDRETGREIGILRRVLRQLGPPGQHHSVQKFGVSERFPCGAIHIRRGRPFAAASSQLGELVLVVVDLRHCIGNIIHELLAAEKGILGKPYAFRRELVVAGAVVFFTIPLESLF